MSTFCSEGFAGDGSMGPCTVKASRRVPAYVMCRDSLLGDAAVRSSRARRSIVLLRLYSQVKLVYYAAHDTNLLYVAELLDLKWVREEARSRRSKTSSSPLRCSPSLLVVCTFAGHFTVRNSTIFRVRACFGSYPAPPPHFDPARPSCRDDFAAPGKQGLAAEPHTPGRRAGV